MVDILSCKVGMSLKNPEQYKGVLLEDVEETGVTVRALGLKALCWYIDKQCLPTNSAYLVFVRTKESLQGSCPLVAVIGGTCRTLLRRNQQVEEPMTCESRHTVLTKARLIEARASWVPATCYWSGYFCAYRVVPGLRKRTETLDLESRDVIIRIGVWSRFAEVAGLSLEPVARRPQDPDDIVEDTTWTSVRLVVLEARSFERYVLLAYELQEPTDNDEPSSDPGLKADPAVLQWFSGDWPIQSYSERYRIIHWHGTRGIGDFKLYLGDEDDTRRFLKVFMTGRAREAQLAERDAVRLRHWQPQLFDIIRHTSTADQMEADQEDGTYEVRSLHYATSSQWNLRMFPTSRQHRALKEAKQGADGIEKKRKKVGELAEREAKEQAELRERKEIALQEDPDPTRT
ncbi:hypothetical protein C8T65DRAFT_697053 [Cerioporus squamosus]|nr:hypothetical protein C8T65DRAFT_697053 [Cerioporus squamosus]